MLTFENWKSKNFRKILNRISLVTAIISVFQESFILNYHGIKIGHGTVIEDLGCCDLRFAVGKFAISKKTGVSDVPTIYIFIVKG